MTALTPCPGCGRHVRSAEATCPFCTFTRASTGALHLVGGAVTVLVLAACYGDSGFQRPSLDADGDLFTTEFDCDDSDADINPDAEEVCDDGIDNNCNGLIDEDDGDCAETDDTDTDGGS